MFVHVCVYVRVWVDVCMSVWTAQQWSPQKHGYILYKNQDSSFLETDMVLSLAQLVTLSGPAVPPGPVERVEAEVPPSISSPLLSLLYKSTSYGSGSTIHIQSLWLSNATIVS